MADVATHTVRWLDTDRFAIDLLAAHDAVADAIIVERDAAEWFVAAVIVAYDQATRCYPAPDAAYPGAVPPAQGDTR